MKRRQWAALRLIRGKELANSLSFSLIFQGEGGGNINFRVLQNRVLHDPNHFGVWPLAPKSHDSCATYNSYVIPAIRGVIQAPK